MADLVLFGAGHIAQVAKVYIDRHGPDRVVGFTVDSGFMTGDSLDSLPVVAWEELEGRFPPGEVKLLGPLSYRRMNDFRRDRHREGRSRGYEFSSFIHPACHIYTEDIGENCFILESNIIQPFARIGAGVMMWSGNHIGHHCVVGDYCFLSSQVGFGGGANIGARCFVAGKAGVDSGVSVGEGCFLGFGVVVKNDLPADSVVPGVADAIAPYAAHRIKRLV
jgi:sugar O-acyltransferase (sialic acid O-acetyltransferase NeuD family)